MLAKQSMVALLVASAVWASMSVADDTELYVYESSARAGARPQVLIIFDNSGSMRTIENDAEANYDPAVTYPAVGSDNSLQERMIYFTKGGVDNSAMPVPDSPSESRRFLATINGCESSWTYLERYGVFTGFFREYGFKGQNGSWQQVPDSNGANLEILDCFEDIENKKWRNADGQPFGFPVDSEGSKQNPVRYTYADNHSTEQQFDAALTKAKLTGFGTGEPLTLYTDNYLRWFHGDKETEPKSRLQIAKEVISNTIVTTPGVDFGLAVFNINHPRENFADGGRIIKGISHMDEATKLSILSTINDLDPETNTPLCETLYEASQYFGGLNVDFGDDDKKPSNYNYRPNTPPRDMTIEKNGRYESPFKSCQNQAYVVYITDGKPTVDEAANAKITSLPGVNSTKYYDSKNNISSYLPNLAEWMHKHDVNDSLPDMQTVNTYTIGFSDGANDAAPLLKKTAELGGGEYYAAKNASQLQAALQQVFSEILEVNASFTSPSIASNNFDRTQTFDSVYYAMFLPNKGPRWMGNLKKFKVSSRGDIVDVNGVKAIGSDGSLKSSACSYWTKSQTCTRASNGGDGNEVALGGAAEVLRDTANRVLYSNIGSHGSLAALNVNNATNFAGGSDALSDHLGVSSQQFSHLFNWLKGQDVDDDDGNNNTSERRLDILGDPLHSKPLAINFGSETSPDIRILVGTNHGFLHMFKDAGHSVTESWAFMPYELLPNVRELRANVPTGVHSVYGIDSPPIAHVFKDASGQQKVWLFVGMRRGGNSYYALDISNPDSPKMMWKVGSDSDGMSELGQSWAEPIITKIPGWPIGNTDGGSAKPVVIIGAGYSPAGKDAEDIGLDDSRGRGIFILDAATGALVYHIGRGSGGKVLSVPSMKDSIPNSVAVLDSNGDRLTDRIYATDTAANVWRIDLPGPNPTDSDRPWTAFKFASLGNDTISEDRRFFAEPVVAQTVFSNLNEVQVTVDGTTTTKLSYQNVPYDAVVVGSGHRPHPTDKRRNDMFFVLQDRNVVSQSFGTSQTPVPAPLSLSDLYNVTHAAPESQADNVEFGLKRGWYYDFGGIGEKTLAGATILQGRVFFTSYLPGNTNASDSCLVAGEGRLYGFDLHKGTRSYQQEYMVMGERVPDTPQLVIPPSSGDGNDNYMYLIGIGAAGDEMLKIPADNSDGCAEGDNKCVGGGLGVNRIYYHIDE
ncbi:pilus assembly protein [Shewanella sp. NIFS-20-20]|uniref:pilus assembly protein n=1 Tax=Shewanella sp. NIFS-20-20 TaxID=2853806 RepID=UPI001C44CD81|nr:PilC/PilY family type IV pilus protein [Shewanella sp. NIFS-20-20]MBV7314179.1 rRNA (guanine-N1)-methyltransferase [Shewanella sp. NIFS-20-20]